MIVLATSAYLNARPAHAQTSLSVAAGFSAQVYESGLTTPTALAVGPDGRLYVAQANGVILAIGRSGRTTIATNFAVPLGLTWYKNVLYVSSTGEISTLTPSKNYKSFSRRVIVQGLPNGKHQNDNIAFWQGWMYVGIGSTCNACVESDRRSASIMRFYPNGSHAQVYAHGLRNPYGLAVRPATNRLYATDNGRDDYGNSVPDELNLITQGGNYGWPNCWGNGGGSNCAGTIAPVLEFEPHSSADTLVFYRGTAFPAAYRNDAFVTEWGDSVNGLGTGHILKRVHFQGSRVSLSTFATGFSNPLGMVLGPSGALLVGDYGSGIIWRIAPTGH